MKKIKLLVLSILSLSLTGCVFNNNNMKDIDIYTTTYPITYLTTYLYGNYSTIHSIYPTGVNINEFNLSDKKINEYAKSDLFIFNGYDKDRDYAVKMLNSNKNLKIIDTSSWIDYEYSVTELWLNPNNYLMMAQNIKNGLNEYINDPYISDEISNNFDSLNKDLSKLDSNIKEMLKSASYKTIVVDNDGFKFLESLLADDSFTVLSLDETEETNITYTVKDGDTLESIANELKVSQEEIITKNNIENNKISKGQTLEITIKTISNNTLNQAKELINENKIKYIYSFDTTANDTVINLINNYNIELITLNDMNTIDGGINNSNENYLTIMNNNIELLKKELYK